MHVTCIINWNEEEEEEMKESLPSDTLHRNSICNLRNTFNFPNDKRMAVMQNIQMLLTYSTSSN